jgi:hypothetical protein
MEDLSQNPSLRFQFLMLGTELSACDKMQDCLGKFLPKHPAMDQLWIRGIPTLLADGDLPESLITIMPVP